jgi:hypothetical protein
VTSAEVALAVTSSTVSAPTIAESTAGRDSRPGERHLVRLQAPLLAPHRMSNSQNVCSI